MKPAPFTRCECATMRDASGDCPACDAVRISRRAAVEARQARVAELRAQRVAEQGLHAFSRAVGEKLRAVSAAERARYDRIPHRVIDRRRGA